VADEYDVDGAVASDLLGARWTATLVLEHVGDVPVDQDADCPGGTSRSPMD
jgi:hypothetical protein